MCGLQVMFCCFLVLQFLEDLVEFPSPEEIETFATQQNEKREELHFKVRTICALFLDVNAFKSGSFAKDKYHYLTLIV